MRWLAVAVFFLIGGESFAADEGLLAAEIDRIKFDEDGSVYLPENPRAFLESAGSLAKSMPAVGAVSVSQALLIKKTAWAMEIVLKEQQELLTVENAEQACNLYLYSVDYEAKAGQKLDAPHKGCRALRKALGQFSSQLSPAESSRLQSKRDQASRSTDDLCKQAKQDRRDVWHYCKKDADYNEILRYDYVVDELNKLSDREKVRAIDFLVPAGGLPARFAVELYNTMAGSPNCAANAENFYANSKYFDECPKAGAYAVEIKEFIYGSPISDLAAAGMISPPDSPATVTYAKFPPPPIPGWSEEHEPEQVAQAVAPTSAAQPSELQPQQAQPEAQQTSDDEAAVELAETPASGPEWSVVAGALFVLAAVGGFLLLRRRKSD